MVNFDKAFWESIYKDQKFLFSTNENLVYPVNEVDPYSNGVDKRCPFCFNFTRFCTCPTEPLTFNYIEVTYREIFGLEEGEE